MESYEIIKCLREEVSKSKNRLLDYEIMDQNQIERVAGFFQSGSIKTDYVDVPIKSVISIGRKGDSFQDGDCWRHALGRLQGKNWLPSVFNYFSEPIRDKDFPAEGAKHRLELKSYGGVTICCVGNHRLVAGYCWLAARVGDTANLLQVHTTLVPLNYSMIQLVDGIHEDNATISVISECDSNSFCRLILKKSHVIRIKSPSDVAYYAVGDDGLEILWQKKTLIRDKIKNLVNSYDADQAETLRHQLEQQRWDDVPKSLFALWRDRRWFEAAYNSCDAGY